MVSSCTSSGLLSVSGSPLVVSNRPSKVHAVTLIQASAACTAIVYDNATTNSGLAVAQVNNTVNTSTVTLVFNVPVECDKGATIALTGTGCQAIVHYSPM